MAKSRLLRLKDKSSHIYFDKNLLEDLTYIHRKSHSSKHGILEIVTSAVSARKRLENSSGQRSRRKGSGPSRKIHGACQVDQGSADWGGGLYIRFNGVLPPQLPVVKLNRVSTVRPSHRHFVPKEITEGFNNERGSDHDGQRSRKAGNLRTPLELAK
jgi:hypothetical protein